MTELTTTTNALPPAVVAARASSEFEGGALGAPDDDSALDNDSSTEDQLTSDESRGIGIVGQGLDAWRYVSGPVGGPVDTWHDRTWGRVENVLGAAGRHATNNLGGLGMPGSAWNVRDAYRNDYTPDKRLGAGLGDALTIGVAALILHSWRSRQFVSPAVYGLPPKLVTVAGMAFLGAAAASGVARTVQDTQDDGHLGAVAAATAAAGAALLSRNVSGKWTGRAAMVLGPVLAGVAGYQLGMRVKVGDGHLGEPYGESSRLEHAPPLAAARGAWNHFAEAGPLSQGTSFGSTWGQVAAMRERYTDAELAGGMAGDLFAGTIVGTTALIATGRVLGRAQTSALTRTPLARLGMELSVPARVVNKLRDVDGLLKVSPGAAESEVEKIAIRTAENVGRRRQEALWGKLSKYALKYDGKVPQLLYIAGGALFAYTMWEAWNAGENSKNRRIGGPISMGVTGAGVIGGAALIAKFAPGVRDLPRAVKPGVAIIAASAIAASISLLREPIGSFVDGAVELHERRGARADGASTALAGAGLLAGTMTGERAAKIMGFSGGLRAGSVVLGAAVGAAAGWGFAPLVSPRHPSTGPTEAPAS